MAALLPTTTPVSWLGRFRSRLEWNQEGEVADLQSDPLSGFLMAAKAAYLAPVTPPLRVPGVSDPPLIYGEIDTDIELVHCSV
jgi:hypothetical protein